MDAMSGGSDDAQEQGSYVAEEQQQQQQQQQQGQGPCGQPQTQLYQCLQDQQGSAAACQFYFDALRQCQENERFASASN